MRIFGRKKKTEYLDLTLLQGQGQKKYDFFSALAKSLLLFLLTYGSLGGFLSALAIEYNSGLCMFVFFVLALLLSAVYETEKRWLTNLTSILIFAVYVYISFSRYRLINSGFYEIVNRCYEIARQYLSVSDGMVYLLNINDPYTTVTVLVLFLGMVEVIILNIMLQNKCSLFKVVLLTLPPYVIPLYFDRSPDLIHMIFLLTGYLTTAILRGGNLREKLSTQMRYVLPLALAVAVLIVRITSFILPENEYNRLLPKSNSKKASEETMVQFAQYGLMALFHQSANSAGVSGGRLSKSAFVLPSYETVLKVRYTPYDFQSVYLKAFTGMNYQGDRWTEANDYLDDGIMFMSMFSRMENYFGVTKDGQLISSSTQGRGIMEVERLDENDTYEYRPYYTDVQMTKQQGNAFSYTYYPAVSRTEVVDDEISSEFLEVPLSCKNAVRRVCEQADFSGTEEELAAQIVSYFQDNYSYTLRPGIYIGNPDYITHFLLESKKGYCAHFASAATMLFRYMGVPARYVEGYAFSYQDVVEGGSLVEDAYYDDYYDGYAPLGETALVELELSDSYAHAWVEIYVQDQGWITVDPTPVLTSQEGTSSFWDAFMNGSLNATDSEISENNFGAYLEGALGGISYLLPGAAALFLLGILTVYLLRAYREKRLPGRVRIRLEYGRIQSHLSRKHQDFQKLRTLHEQLEWIRSNSRLKISQEQETALYQVYFAENADCDCEKLYRQLRQIKRTLYFRFSSNRFLSSR